MTQGPAGSGAGTAVVSERVPAPSMARGALVVLAVGAVAYLLTVVAAFVGIAALWLLCLLYTSPSPRDVEESRMPSSA